MRCRIGHLVVRLAVVAALGAAALAAWRRFGARPAQLENLPEPQWPRFTPDAPAASAPSEQTEVAELASATEVTPRWRPPVGGACPPGYPIKANAGSGIFHVPGGRFYERTIPERCYADPAEAQADGYRRAKA